MFNLSDKSDILSLSTVPEKILKSKNLNKLENEVEKKYDKNFELEDFHDIEKKYIKRALEIFGYDTEAKKQISNKMGIGLTTLYRKIQKYNL